MKESVFMLGLILMAFGCWETSLPLSSRQAQPESKTESHQQPCIDRPPTNLAADAAMLRTVRRLGILPDIQSMTPQNAALAMKAQSVVVVLMGFYGDPQMPSVPSMADFSDLADDPHAQKALGKAFSHLDRRDDSGAAAVERSMTNAERSYFTTTSTTIGAINGIGGSDAEHLEMPLIGTMTALNSKSYLNRMLQESDRLRVVLNRMPDNSRAIWWLEYRTDQLIDKLNAGCGK